MTDTSSGLLFTGADWDFATLQNINDACETIARDELGLDVYPNQIEVITAEQMLDAYSSVGMPLFYKHWSFGKHFAHHEALYRKGLHFESFKVIEETTTGRRTRKLAVTPQLEAPGPIKKLLGDSISYIEDGHLDPAKPSWVTRVLPSKLADKANISSELWLERTGPGQSDRVAAFDIEVKIFGIGGMFEKFLEKTMREELRTGADREAARRVGLLLAERAKAAGVEQVMFDRGGYRYHGRVKALADGAREGGLSF